MPPLPDQDTGRLDTLKDLGAIVIPGTLHFRQDGRGKHRSCADREPEYVPPDLFLGFILYFGWKRNTITRML